MKQEEAEDAAALQLLLFSGLLIVCFSCCHVLKQRPVISKWIPESLCVLLIGMAASLIINVANQMSEKPTKFTIIFNGSVFYYGLLPPLIYSAAYHMKREIFFRNAIPIGLLASLGTLVSNCVISTGIFLLVKYRVLVGVDMGTMELLAFGALMSSTDPVATLSVFNEMKVDPTLFYIILGESILNDAIAITAFRSATKYVVDDLQQNHRIEYLLAGFMVDFFVTFLGSMLLGYALGIVSAIWLKYVGFSTKEYVASIGLLAAFIVLPFYAAESSGMNGIVATLFSGISMRRYTKKNLSPDAQTGLSFLIHFVASMAELSCFLLVGLNLLSAQTACALHWGLIGWTFFLCLLGRALAVYPLLSALNLSRWARGGVYEPAHSSLTAGTGSITLGTMHTMESIVSPMPTHAISIDVAPSNVAMLKMTSSNSRNKLGPTSLNLIPFRTMAAAWFAGLRGVVAFSCALGFSNANGNLALVTSTTSLVILLSLVIFGCLTEHVITSLGVPMGIDPSQFLKKLKTFGSSSLRSSRREKDFEEVSLHLPYCPWLPV